MKAKHFLRFLLFLGVTLFLVTPLVYALELPTGITALQQEHRNQAQAFSLLLAFIGGILSILSPCFLPLFPSYVAYMFKEKKDITKMTAIFFAGLSTVFILLGLGATAFGKILESYRIQLIEIAGIVLILLGIAIAFGKGMSFMRLKKTPGHDSVGVALFGAAFALGFIPCIGAILFVILFIAATFHNYLYSVLLLFTYSFGLILPYFVLSIAYDRYRWHTKPWIRGKEFLLGKIPLNTTQLISGGIIILLGTLFVWYKGTYIVNTFDPLGTMRLFYYLNDLLINVHIPPLWGNIVGFLLILFAITAIYTFIKKRGSV